MLNYLKAAVLLAACFCLIFAGLFFREAMSAARGAGLLVADTRVFVAETQRRLVDTSQNTNAVLLQVGLAADNVRRASESQKQVTKKTLAILSSTDALIRQVASNTQDITDHADTTLDAANQVLGHLDETSVALTHTVRSADVLITDPKLTEILGHINDTTAQANIAVANVAATTKKVDVYVERITKPASLLQRVFMGLLDVGYKARLVLGF